MKEILNVALLLSGKVRCREKLTRFQNIALAQSFDFSLIAGRDVTKNCDVEVVAPK